MISAEAIKNLRDKTGLSVMLCKRALEESGGEQTKAMGWLKEHGAAVAKKKSERSVNAGLIEAYIHNNGQVGVLLELRTETDFVAKNPAFKELAHNIAMHIAAANPPDVKALLGQEYIKNLDLTISEYINENVQKFGENIEVAGFERFEI
ncbi:MAG: translation elongation factor Ts [Candidatus Tagabacteria bacterium CG09_land_8_20_14_0_10_41_14]|uniref:Elongation factor Ts n=2 Tax=Candidatus Tagaibacteriota TaxID=1817918 RepID=A0A2H0WMR7_9BACT|nr:MAG: translation elongation factor Ts [Candidatus Tagabacteria bacterium CG09_land_8_20_14_0_10_41_14]PJE73079.1 MAG: translation elongation factor Ts [Candidatus Tagabacteria bacterium CG10_big_fil_rev_8_21_14_0_10_40_13]